MLAYYFRLALKSLRRNPMLTSLMIGAIAVGVGVCITTLTVYRLMSGNPVAHRNDVLYSVTLDNWDPNSPWRDEHPELPPPELTYRDAQALYQSSIPDRKVMMRKASFVVEPPAQSGAKPFLTEARLTTKDFFGMFDVPFEYGAGWDQAADDSSQMVVVLSKKTNDRAFGGANSVGKTLRLDGHDFKVIGVLAEWAPTPKFYDMNNGTFDEIEELFAPYGLGTVLQLQSAGNTNCWRNEDLNTYQDFLNSDCVWIQFWAELRGSDKVAAFQDFIDNYVREQKQLGRFERPLNNHLRRPDEWLRINEAVEDDNRVLVGLSFMFLAVCLLNMIGLLLAKFHGVAPFVGVRRALGATTAAIFQQHLMEGGVIGLCGGAFGVAIGAFGLIGVRHLYESYEGLTRLDLPTVFTALSIAVLSGLLAGFYPAWRACRVDPAVYLKTQ